MIQRIQARLSRAHVTLVNSPGLTNSLMAGCIVVAGLIILGMAYLAVNPSGEPTLEEMPIVPVAPQQ